MNTHVTVTRREADCARSDVNGGKRRRPANDFKLPVSRHWPKLDDLALTAEQLNARNRGIGGSDANIILSGDDERILRLWREKRGESSARGPQRQAVGGARLLDRGLQPPMVREAQRQSRGRCRQGADLQRVSLAQVHARWPGRGQRRGVRGQAHQQLRQGRRGARALHAPAAAQHGGGQG